MLTMDQVLASNELTVAISAAIPGFVAIGSFLYVIKNYISKHLFRPVERIKGGIPTLRIALAEVGLDVLYSSLISCTTYHEWEFVIFRLFDLYMMLKTEK